MNAESTLPHQGETVGATTHRQRWPHRRRTILIAVILVTMLVVLYLLATVPVEARTYALTINSTPLPALASTDSGIIYANDSGTGGLWVPAGSEVSGTWAAGSEMIILITIQYGSSSYESNTTASGSFHLAGGSPFSPGSTMYVFFLIISPSSVTIAIQGSYTAPLV